ncbi:MAG TPA: stalk domain-containing protein [Caldisericia bacterium]|nr:stalk domain-containing protein [Caldisericia bacterium]
MRLKKLFRIFLLLILIFNIFFVSYDKEVLNSESYSDIGNGVWVHIATFQNVSDSEVIDLVKFFVERDIKNVFFLAKYVDGELLYKKYKDTLIRIVKIFKNYGINVHFYIPISYDPLYLKNNPQEATFLSPNKNNNNPYRDPELKVVSLGSDKYLNYIKNIVKELIYDFDADGIQLDYIRYPNINYGYEDKVKNRFIELGGDWNKILNIFRKGQNIFELYDQKDKDVLLLGRVRSEFVTNFTGEIKSFISSISSNILFSVTLIQSASSFLSYKDGGIDSYPYGFLHFGQDYTELSNFCDFVCPLAYHKNYNKSVEWIREIIKNSKKRVNSKILCGIGVNDTGENIEKAIKICKEEGVNFNLFRLGTFIPVNLEFTPTDILSYSLKTSPLLKFYEYKIKNDEFNLKIDKINFSKKITLASTINFNSEKSNLNVYLNGDHPVILSTPMLRTFSTLKMRINENYIYFEGVKKEIDTSIFIYNGRTMVPVRFIAENFGFEVTWKDGEVILENDKNKIKLYIGKNEIFVNGNNIMIDSSPILKDGRTFLPIRYISEALNLIVSWNEQKKEVTIEGYINDDIEKIIMGLNSKSDYLRKSILFSSKKIYFLDSLSKSEILNLENQFLLRGIKIFLNYNENNIKYNSPIIDNFVLMGDKGSYVINGENIYNIFDATKNFSLQKFVDFRFKEKNEYYILINKPFFIKLFNPYIERDTNFSGFILIENS